MATKELAVKFTEIGLQKLTEKVEQSAARMGKRLDEIVKKVKQSAAEIAAAQSGELGAGEIDGTKLEQELSELATRLQKAVTAAFKNLRVQSERDLNNLRETARSSFAALQESGLASTREVERAQAGLAAKLRSLATVATSIPQAITAAFRNLNVESSAAVEQMKRNLVADFVAIKTSGVATPGEISQAWTNLKEKIRGIDNREVANSFKRLGIESQTAIEALKQQAVADFATIKQSGIASSNDIERAFRVLKARLRELNTKQEFTIDTQVVQGPNVDAAFKSLGVKSEAQIRQLKQDAVANFATIKQSGVATAGDIARAFEALKERLRALDLKVTPKLDDVKSAFDRLGVQSQSTIEALKRQAVQDFGIIRNDGRSTASDIERAFAALKARLRALNLELKVNAKTDEVERAFNNLGLKSANAINVLKRAAVDDFRTIARSGVASAEDIERAYAALKARLRELNLQISTRNAPSSVPTREVEDAFQRLGIQSERTLSALKTQAVADFKAIKDSGVSAAGDIERAYQQLKARLRELNLKIEVKTQNAQAPAALNIEDAFKGLGIQSSAAIAELKKQAVEQFAAIKRSGQASAADIERAFAALKGLLRDLNKKITVETNAQDIEESFRALGIRSSKALDDAKRNLLAQFATIKQSGVASAEDIGRAYTALKARLKALRLEFNGVSNQNLNIIEVEDAFKRLGITSDRTIEQMKATAQRDFDQIKNSGVASADDIARAFTAMSQKIAAANALRNPVPSPNAKDPFSTLNVTSLAQYRAKQQEIIQAFNDIKKSGTATSADLQNAHRGMTTQLRQLNQEFVNQNRVLQGSESNWRKLLFTVSGVALAISGLVFTMTGLALAISKPFREIGKLEGQFERFEATLRSLGDTSNRAKESTAWVKDLVFNSKTVFSTEEVTDAFIRMRAVGIDPTKGSLESLLNAIAATGGTAENLNRAAFAIQQIASKGRAYSEEVIQQLAEALPGTVQIVARAFGFVEKDTGKLLEQMKKKGIGARDFLQALFNELQKSFGNASSEFLNTFPGILLRFKAQYQKFVDDTANAGAFDSLKKTLKEIQDEIDAAFKDGRAQEFAKNLSDALVSIIEIGKSVVQFFRDWGKELVILIGTVAGFKLLGSIIGGIISAFQGLALARVALAGLVTGVTSVGTALAALRVVALRAFGPAGWLVGLALAFYEAAKGADELKKKTDEAARAQQRIKNGGKATLDDKANAQDVINKNNEQIKALEEGNARVRQSLAKGGPPIADAVAKVMQDRLKAREATIASLKKQNVELQKVVDFVPKDPTDPKDKPPVGGLDKVPNSTGSTNNSELDRLRRARRADEEQDFKDRVELIRSHTQTLVEQAQSEFDQRLIGIKEFHRRALEAEQNGLREERAVLQERINFLQKTPVKDEADRIDLNRRIKDLKNEQLKIDEKILQVESKHKGEEARQLAELQAKLDQLQEDLDRASGNPRQAIADRLKREFEILRKDIENEFADDPIMMAVYLNVVNRTEALATARAVFEQLEQDVFQSQGTFQIKAETAGLNFDQGISTRLEALANQAQAAREYAAELEKISAEMKAQIDALREQGEDVSALEIRWQRVQVELGRARIATNAIGAEIKDKLTGGLQGFFDRIIDGTDNVASSWKKLGQDLRSMFLKLIAEDLISKLFRGNVGADGKAQPGLLTTASNFIGNLIKGPSGDKPAAQTAAAAAGGKQGADSLFDFSGLFGMLRDGFGDVFGKLGNMFSGLFSGLGDLISTGISAFKGLFGFAEGGLFRGKGDDTSDSNIIAVSDHEYIMPAKETRKWLPVLETMRAGKFGDWLRGIVGLQSSVQMPRTAHFAQGGLVSGQSLVHQVRSIEKKAPAANVSLRLEPGMINMTLRDWLEGELGRIAATR